MVRVKAPVTGVCSSITTRPRRVLRSASGASLDVQGSIVAKNIWLFENVNYKQTSSEELSVESVDCGESCCKHTWWLSTNLQPSQLCAKCNKRIGTRRAVHKCTVCKGVFHLKCASQLDEENPNENRAPRKMDVRDFVPSKEESPAKHVPCQSGLQVAKNKKCVPFSRLPVNNKENIIIERKPAEINNNDFEEILTETIEDLEEPDPATETSVSTRSQARQKLTGMKNTFVKRCLSLKKKVKCLKEKVGPSNGSSGSQNDQRSGDLDTPVDSAEEERVARMKSPVLKRVRLRQAEIRADSIRRRAGPYTKDPKRRRQVAMDVDYSEIRDRLEILERKLNKLEHEIPAEVREWNLLRLKFRGDYSRPVNMDNEDCLHQERNAVSNDTHTKEIAANSFPSVNSGTSSDEVFVVPDASTSSHDDGGHVTQAGGHVTQAGHMTTGSAGSEQDDSSLLPSGIPNRLKLDIKGESCQSFSNNQTSTPVTNCELSFRSASKQYAKMHKITHKNITMINMGNSTSEDSSCKLRGGTPTAIEAETTGSSKTSSDQGQRRVLSPEQIAVRSFLEKRKTSSSSFSCSPTHRLNLSASPPAASSTFRNGDLCSPGSPQPNMSPVSFTLRHDLTGGSQSSFAKILDESKLQDRKLQYEDPNSPVMSELSCTFRNDSQMAPMGAEENLPGYTTNYFAAQTYTTTESESEPENNPYGNRITVEADIEIDGHVDDVRLVRQDMDCATSVDGTSLTNVTEFSADEVNSFSDKKDEVFRSRWINKDVFMFNCNGGIRTKQAEKQGLSRQGKEDVHVDETGDGKKPPILGRRQPAAAKVNFLKEAERHLEHYQNRRQQEVCPGVYLEKLPRSSVLPTLHTDSAEEPKIELDIVKERTGDLNTNETHEFEEMEKQVQDESISYGIALSKSLTDVSKPELPKDGCRFGRSISCSNSVDGETRSMINENAKYHFLHEKGMIKISSPGLKIVSGSPSAKKRAREITDILEESSELLKSGSESDLNEFVIDNKFSLIGNSDILSSQSGTSDHVSSDINQKQKHLEAELLDGYLRTVDKNQETWNNVLSWMERDCVEPGVEELQEELERMIGQSEETAGHGSNSPVDNSVYYSFHGQSEELRNILSPCQSEQTPEATLKMEEEEEDGMFPNLMETILHGTIKQVKKLMNSDRTISELEIKEATAWALERQNYEISWLLLQDVCRLLEAAEGVNCVEVFPAYRKGHRWEPLFVVLSKQNFQGEWDSFMGFSVYRRRYDFVSPEAALVINSDLVRNNPLSLEDFTTLKRAISSAELHNQHGKITVVNACPYRSRRGGEVLEKGMCIVIHSLIKGFIPFDEEAFPEEIAGIPVDVREGYCQLGVRTPPERRRALSQPWEEGQSVSEDTNSQASQSVGSVCHTGSQSSGQSLSQFNSSASSSSFVADLQDDASRMLVQHLATDFEGDVVMGPSGDTDSILDKEKEPECQTWMGPDLGFKLFAQVHAMDIDQMSEIHVGTKSKDFNQQLLMGTCIGPVGGEGSGTLGGYVVLEDGGLAALTCAHVTSRQKFMSQPAEAELENGKSARRCVFGRVCQEVFEPGSIDETGVDAAAIIIMERFPEDAQFVWARKEQLKFAGFDPTSPPRFSNGEILRLQDITPRKRHTSVLKIGAETGLTSGKLYLDGLYIRTSNREMRLPRTQQMIEFFNQMEVASVQGMSTRFFDLGDSGALVFMPLNGSELYCIGQCIGCTSYGSCVVTPIEDVFNKLKVRNFKDFTRR